MMLPFRLLDSRFEVMNCISIMISGLICPVMPWALCLGCLQTDIIVAN